MNQLDNDRYRTDLEHRASDLRLTLQRRGDIAVERAADQLDDTLLAAERESATHELERASALLRQIEAALGRLRCGTYGYCLRCSVWIGAKRLNAVPWTQYCLACQQRVDSSPRQWSRIGQPS